MLPIYVELIGNLRKYVAPQKPKRFLNYYNDNITTKRKINNFLDRLHAYHFIVRDLLSRDLSSNPHVGYWTDPALNVRNRFIQTHPQLDKTRLKNIAWDGPGIYYAETSDSGSGRRVCVSKL